MNKANIDYRNINMKRCAKCGQYKAIEEFSPNPRKWRPNKRHHYCHACMIVYLREYRQTVKSRRFAEVMA